MNKFCHHLSASHYYGSCLMWLEFYPSSRDHVYKPNYNYTNAEWSQRIRTPPMEKTVIEIIPYLHTFIFTAGYLEMCKCWEKVKSLSCQPADTVKSSSERIHSSMRLFWWFNLFYYDPNCEPNCCAEFNGMETKPIFQSVIYDTYESIDRLHCSLNFVSLCFGFVG